MDTTTDTPPATTRVPRDLQFAKHDRSVVIPHLVALLRLVPGDLEPAESPFPLLDSLHRLDRRRGTDVARELIFIAAGAHRHADERRTAEYLLRNRSEVVSGTRPAHALVSAARCAAEMDVRRQQCHEMPTAIDVMASIPATPCSARIEEPSVGELVVSYLHRAIGRTLALEAADALLNAVAVFLALAERHGLKSGCIPSLIAMRPAARKDARLVTHLRGALPSPAAARSLARLLVGADGTALETALLFWAAQGPASSTEIPDATSARWNRDSRAVERALTPICCSRSA